MQTTKTYESEIIHYEIILHDIKMSYIENILFLIVNLSMTVINKHSHNIYTTLIFLFYTCQLLELTVFIFLSGKWV